MLYHSTHGLCQIKEVVQQKQMDKDALYYALVPKSTTRMSERFLIPVDHIATSGFHSLVSPQQANAVLDFLKGRNGAPAHDGPVWGWASDILTFCREMPQAREQRKRQIMQQSLRGLIGELAIVLGISLQEVADKVRKNLEFSFKLNPPILSALSHAADV